MERIFKIEIKLIELDGDSDILPSVENIGSGMYLSRSQVLRHHRIDFQTDFNGCAKLRDFLKQISSHNKPEKAGL